METHEEQKSDGRLCEFIRTNRDALIADWTERVRQMSPAAELSRTALVDHLPDILARLAEMVESVHTGKTVTLADVPKKHAVDRLARGFDLEEVIKEFSLLRQCTLALWERTVGSSITVMELRRLDAALDQSIADSTVSFARARERMLRAVDNISDAALGTADLEAFLQKVLQATLETTEAVDAAAVFLREGDVLRLRAAVGIEEDLSLIRHAATDPTLKSQRIEDKGIRALYEVPLSHAGSVIGVAYIGSRTAAEFSEEDKLLFRTMTSRVTSAIIQTKLVADLEKTIADRDRAVSQLAGERSRLEQILNQIPIGILIADAQAAKLAFVNKRCQEIIGHELAPEAPASEYNGWKPFHLDGREYRPEETPRRRALRGEELVDELKVRRPDGNWVMIRAHAAPVRDADGKIQSAVVAFQDVSGQKRYEERLHFLSKASRELAESIDYETTLAKIARLALPVIADWVVVDLVRDGELTTTVVAHSDPAKTKAAKEYRRQFPPKLDAGQGLAKVLREGQPELYEQITEDMLVAGAQSAEHLRSLRELAMRSAMIVPLKARGRIVGAITFVTAESGRRYDHSDLEMAQELADRAAIAVENARLYREAERAIRVRENVLALVSHDLRNPLSSINMSAATLLNVLVKKGPSDPRTQKQVEMILRNTRRMDRLIGDLLDMASIQAGRLAVEAVPQEIAPIFAEAVEVAEPLARANGQTLSSEIEVGQARCLIDRERILQLLANLLGNAKKFSPPGGLIVVRAKINGNVVECSVADTGRGIPAKDLPRVFEAYWSAKHEARRGTGLGLYISKGIVEAHGGRIWVDSQVGSGATFFFTLPLVGS